MYNLMRPFFALILFSTISSTIYGQIEYDKEIKNRYDKLYQKLPRELQNELNKKTKDTLNQNGLAIFTEYKCDTLSKNEQNKTALSEIILLDPKTNQPVKANKKVEKYPIYFCQATIQNDTLGILIGGLFMDQAIIHFINKSRVSIFYFEYYKDDSLLKININDSLTNRLNITAKIVHFILSDSAHKVGEIIYGSAEIITSSYFLKDTWDDKHFYKLRWRLKYYFNCRVTKNVT